MREALLALRLDEWVLATLVAWPALGALVVLAFARGDARWRDARALTALALGGEALLAVGLWLAFDPGVTGWQATLDAPLLPRWGARLSLGVDGMSLVLVMLTAALMPLALAASWASDAGEAWGGRRRSHALLLLVTSGTVGVLVSLDLLLFAAFWAIALGATGLLLGGAGGGHRFLARTGLASLLLLGAIVLLWLSAGSRTFGLDGLLAATRGSLSAAGQMYLFGACLLAFAVRAGAFPLHGWLPDAQRALPACAAAAFVVEIAGYALLRLALPFFPAATTHPTLRLALVSLAVAGALYGALLAMAQVELERLVSYAMVSQLGLVLLGILALNVPSVQGALATMVTRATALGGLLLLAGMLRRRRGAPAVRDLAGAARRAPWLAGSLALLALCAVGLPGTVGFVGLRPLLVGAYRAYPIAALLAGVALVGAVARLGWALWRLVAAPARADDAVPLPDLDRRERAVVGVLAVAIVWLGVAPGPLLRRTEGATRKIVDQVMRGAEAATVQAPPFARDTLLHRRSLRPAGATVSVLER